MLKRMIVIAASLLIVVSGIAANQDVTKHCSANACCTKEGSTTEACCTKAADCCKEGATCCTENAACCKEQCCKHDDKATMKSCAADHACCKHEKHDHTK
jgi:hypothetical protein